jgi:D-sedoheptulose 7-phosphate isomerase
MLAGRTLTRVVDDAFDRRVVAGRALTAAAPSVAAAALAMARRFAAGGRLIVFGAGAASTDAQHVVVEFLHPVVVGKRALPAIGLTSDVATLTDIATREGSHAIFASQLRQLAAPSDIALGIVGEPAHVAAVRPALDEAGRRGLLNIVLHGTDDAASGLAVDHTLSAPAPDALLAKELRVTLYHTLWELVHVFLDQPGVAGQPAVASTARRA